MRDNIHILHDYLTGASITEIARRYHLARRTVASMIDDIPREYVRQSNEVLPRWRFWCVERLRLYGLSPHDICVILGITAGQLAKIRGKISRDTEYWKELHESGKALYVSYQEEIRKLTNDPAPLQDPCRRHRNNGDRTFKRSAPKTRSPIDFT